MSRVHADLPTQPLVGQQKILVTSGSRAQRVFLLLSVTDDLDELVV